MTRLDLPRFSTHLQKLDFNALFTDVLGWEHPPRAESAWRDDEAKGLGFRRRMVAHLSGIVVLEVVAGVWPDEAGRKAIWQRISQDHYENLLIFLDREERPAQSLWYWVKRGKDAETGKPRAIPRRHEYFRGQPVDLFASKLHAMVVELSELDAAGRLPVLEAARRLEAALDVEQTTKRFYARYQEQHDALLEAIEGIDDARDRRWYASVILNRLMFVWFLQKKGFLDGGDYDYLPRKFAQSRERGENRFFGEFLKALFFEAFARPEAQRGEDARRLTGGIPYLNGGLFLHHRLELDALGQSRVGLTLNIRDAAFVGVFEVFAAFTWHLDDTPAGNAEEINPDVLGYIFEKYINQKAFGAYYTRPEITGYLAERSIHKLVLERINAPAVPELGLPAIAFDSVDELLARMDPRTALKLVGEVLPSITVLDPAVGSGAFLVAALKALINIYYAVVGRAELGASRGLSNWLKAIQKDHPSIGYYIKRRIVTDNLHGVDIMEEACEIAKLRLFLAMVSSVSRVDDLEPLPNIDFNILPGNSLVGLMRVDEHEFDRKQDDLFKTPFRRLLEEKNRKLDVYRHSAQLFGQGADLRVLRDDIDAEMRHANGILNELLRDQFEALGVKYEQAAWDAARQSLGKPKKRRIERADIDAERPFHWGYVFDEIMQKRGGFDIILANPPWEVFKPQAKEFFADHSDLVTKNKMTIKVFEKEQGKLLRDRAVREAWLEYESRFPHMSAWFRAAPEYGWQSALVGGKKTGSDLNLYKLFVERSFNLLRPGGHCGIVIPSGIYTDLGAKGLRDLLFEHTRIEGLFCFENRKAIFEGVDSRFKFVVLTFEKTAASRLQAAGERGASAPPDDLLAPAAGTSRFPAAFMRHDVAELDRFPGEGALWLDVALIRRLSPDSHSVMEFKSGQDVAIAEKMLRHPLLGEQRAGEWNVAFTAEFHMTNDSKLFRTEPAAGRLPLFEGKMIWQFDAAYEKPRYWVDAKEGRSALLGRREDEAQQMDYQAYRLGFRDIAANTNERTLVAAVIPPTFHGNKIPTVKVFDQDGNLLIDCATQLFLCGIWNSFVIDWMLRQKVTTTINFFYLYQLPIPRLGANDADFAPIVSRAARLTCTTPEFDALAQEVGLRDHSDGATDTAERARLRAELDGLVAHLYGFTEAEFAHILATFPLVDEAVRQAALDAYRDVGKGIVH
ncbi:MAG: hypothetical protein NFCOHLIN_03244 [Gammaproteobacteria bacterium]|nr:hypothetical protein [Gammaproteobacteria bacterium]